VQAKRPGQQAVGVDLGVPRHRIGERGAQVSVAVPTDRGLGQVVLGRYAPDRCSRDQSLVDRIPAGMGAD